MIWPRVPAAVMTPADSVLEYPYRSITGMLIMPMATTLAPTTPVAAASNAPTNTTAKASPPRSRPNIIPMVVSRSSASFDFSSIVPMKMKNGTASSTALLMTPKTRWGKALSKPTSKMSMATPIAAKMSAVPPREKATG